MQQIKYFNANQNNALISVLSKELKLPEKIVELLFSRGKTTKEEIEKFLCPSKTPFLDPFGLDNMDKLINRIKKAAKIKERVLVFGDYDVDGISATTIMIKTLKMLGIKADYYLPNRFEDGYGLTNEVILKVKNLYNPSFIITVDCGISCASEVEFARENGIEIAVTDHHEIPTILPKGIVVNAKIEGQKFGFTELCGTGLAFKISQALIGSDAASQFLPIAAIATIADIVSLTEENRLIVTEGLKLMDKFLPAGVKALFKASGLNIKFANATDISFKIAPKLNAAGRLGEASDALKLYFETNPTEIKALIDKLNEYNTRRQDLCNKVFDDCISMLKKVNLSAERCIILYSKDWDQGILGIVCARLVDTFNRPAILFAERGDMLLGSARSLSDVNIHDMLALQQDILETFGGHTVAAGLSLKKENFNKFVNNVNSYIFSNISQDLFKPVDYYDLDITTSEISSELINAMNKLEPFGHENPRPLFRINAEDVAVSALKNHPQHTNVTINKNLQLIYFNSAQNYFSLKFATNKSFIIDLQGKYNNIYKGIIKSFDANFEFNNHFNKNLNAFALEQLTYLKENGTTSFTEYNESNLINFVSSCEQNCFGTLFVAFSMESYNNFIESYCTKHITNQFLFGKFSIDGFNSLALFPTNIDVYKNYGRIIFLDPILDKSYITKINKISNAEIFILQNKKFNKKIFYKINLTRNSFADFYNRIKIINNKHFLNVLEMYREITKENKLNFNNFYFYLKVFQELKILNICEENDFSIQLNKNKKTELSNSQIYNLVTYICAISGNNGDRE